MQPCFDEMMQSGRTGSLFLPKTLEMTILFAFIGLAAALVANFLIDRLSDREDLEYEDEESRIVRVRLPWHTEPWATRVRFGIALAVPVAFVLAANTFEPVQALAIALLLTALLVCVGTDLLSYRVPDVITYPATAFALVAAAVLPDADIVSAVVAAGAGGGLFYLITLFVPRGGFGLGDVKLAMLIGAGLGIQGAYQALFYGMLAAGLVMLVLLVAGVVSRRQALPYAPFLGISAVAVALIRGAVYAPL
jgi:prepilin signal peptidase PulO-like enzyme (type II secretory pathway)